MHLLSDGGIGVRTVVLVDRFQIETSRNRLTALEAEDDHAAHQVVSAVAPGAAHLPLRPHVRTVRNPAQHTGVNVRYESEYFPPVGANLVQTVEVPTRMSGCLVAIGRVEACHNRVQIMGVRGFLERGEERVRVASHETSYPLQYSVTNILSMERTMTNVKRQYDASARRARAERVRQTLVETAREMLLRDGYAATTIPSLARACDVSTESVYKRFGGKSGLVRAVVTQALKGVGPVAAETRSDALSAGDLQSLVRGWGRLASEIAPRVAPILLIVHAAAAHDPEIAILERELDDARRNRMTDNARRIADVGHLPDRISIERVGDILWTYSSPEIYDLIVLRSGWSLAKYSDFIANGVIAHLHA